MELFTLDRGFRETQIIDKFNSAIWTERYYGDSEVELVVPSTKENILLLQDGTFLGERDSDEVMIIDTTDDKDGNLKVTGGSLLSFLNNRFVRASASHEDKYLYLHGYEPEDVLWEIVYLMCTWHSPYLNGTYPMGVPNPISLAIPGLSREGIHPMYRVLSDTPTYAIPYGPVYDALKEIATTYQIGMKILLAGASDDGYSIQFRTYSGIDRTSDQSIYPMVRFSPDMDSLTNIKELNSIKDSKTDVYTYAPANPDGLATTPGVASVGGRSGFDLRAAMVFADEITTDQVSGNATTLLNLLNEKAKASLAEHQPARAIDGEVVPNFQYRYGSDYKLGDIIEVQGNSGMIQKSRVTEYIRAQDSTGEKAYPTVAMLD